ncbi:MAG TPA: hypothetical protein VGP06_19425 [Janthinobacterium sp.]|nr:hypothetical protein [Janthinobacterium sp.]
MLNSPQQQAVDAAIVSRRAIRAFLPTPVEHFPQRLKTPWSPNAKRCPVLCAFLNDFSCKHERAQDVLCQSRLRYFNC